MPMLVGYSRATKRLQLLQIDEAIDSGVDDAAVDAPILGAGFARSFPISKISAFVGWFENAVEAAACAAVPRG
jgi:hypothetical protein